MKVKSQVEMFFENELHIEKILHLPSLVSESQNLMYGVPHEFDDVLGDMYDNRHSSMDKLWLFFKQDDSDGDSEEDLMNLQELHGYWDVIEECQFLVLFNKAKRYYHSKTSWSSGGIYYTKWIAAPSVARAIQEGKKWAKELDKIDLAVLKVINENNPR